MTTRFSLNCAQANHRLGGAKARCAARHALEDARLLALMLSAWATLSLAACSAPAPHTLDGRLVFERKVAGNGDIYTMAVDGSGLTRLTDNPGWDGQPAWSPDGSQIAFASDRGGGPAIYVMNADGSNQQALTDPSDAGLTPAWSPDGSRIAFASTRPAATDAEPAMPAFAIWVMNADGGDPRRVAGDPHGHLLYPTWGPKSDRIAYMRLTSQGTELVTQLLDEGAAPQPFSAALDGQPGAPAWSPNANRLAFALQAAGLVEVWQARPDGGDPVRLSNGGEPAWSPDGKQIVFVSDQNGVPALSIVGADGENEQTLLADGAAYARPDWR